MKRFFLPLCWLLSATTLWANGQRDLVVVRPGGPTPSEEATSQVSRLIVEIAKRAGWDPESVQASYFNRADDALAHIEQNTPGFLLASPGFFLEQKTALGLRPINQILINGQDTHRYYIMVRKDTLSDLEDLRGNTLAGAVLAEPEFVERVVLEGRFTFGTDLTAEFRRALSALRNLHRGKLDAVILDEMEYAGLTHLPFADELTTLFTSAALPNTGIFELTGVAVETDSQALVEATKDFCSMGEGAAICETYGITGFKPVPQELFNDLIDKFDAAAGSR
jgi:hypothetical protein